MSHRVVVIGSVNADYVVRVDHHTTPGQTVIGQDLQRFPGGKGANQAVAAARLGASVSFAGKVGDDDAGRMLSDNLVRAGVDVRGLAVQSGVPSGVALIVVDGEGENMIVVSPGANHRVTPDDITQALDTLLPTGEPALVVLQCELPPDSVVHAVRLAANRNARVVLNLAPPAKLGSDVIALADPLVVNAHEAAFLLGEGSAGGPGERDAERLLSLGCPSVVVTSGGSGAVCGDRAGIRAFRPPVVDVVDTTGAGDAFTGALATRLAEGAGLPVATEFAVGVGAAAVRAPGAQSSFPNREEAERLG